MAVNGGDGGKSIGAGIVRFGKKSCVTACLTGTNEDVKSLLMQM